MPKSRLRLASGNLAKLAEIQDILGVQVDGVRLNLIEIQALDPADVARAKASEAYKIVGEPIIVDDTGLAIDALGGLPGAFVVWFLETIGAAGIAGILPQGMRRSATATTAIAYADRTGVTVFVGSVSGVISETPRGDRGFGFDSIFVPEGANCTYAEMEFIEKNLTSMRTQALVQLRDFLSSQ
jgi:XTP/dITP diphosphohydrolase